jgi:hypothetical protein
MELPPMANPLPRSFMALAASLARVWKAGSASGRGASLVFSLELGRRDEGSYSNWIASFGFDVVSATMNP